MKSIKGLALGAALAGVVFTGAANADAATVIGKDVVGTKYEEATTKLAALGITKGYPDGTVRPDENVTRAQTAAFMIRALNYQLAMDQSTTIFNDVAYEHPLSGAVQLASGRGIIKGYLDGTFRPEESVTIAQASAILVRMLGYGPAINEADFPNSHLAKAAELGILKGVQADVNAPAKRGDIMLMVANALTVDIMKQDTWGTEQKWTEQKDQNILTEYFDLTVIETKKDFEEAFGKDRGVDLPVVRDTARTKIGSLKANELEFNGIGGVHTLNEMFNATDFLAQEVQVWVDEDEDHVVYIAGSKDQKVVVDLADKWDDANKEKIKLSNGDKYDINVDKCKVYYNLEDVKDFKKLSDAEKDKLVKGTVILKVVLDSNDDVVAIVATSLRDSYFGLVEAANADKKIIDFMDGSATTSQLKLDGKDFFIVRDGAIATLDDLEEEDVVNYYRDGDKYYILATSEKVSGTIDDVKFTDPDDITTYDLVIDGKKYDVSADATYSDNNNEDIDTLDTDDIEEMEGVEATLYLDAAGDVRHIVTGELDSTAGNVAVVTKNVKWLVQDEEWELTLVNEFGKEVKYRFEYDDIDINGAEPANNKEVLDALSISAQTNDIGTAAPKYAVDNLLAVEYSVDKDGKLKSLDILSNTSDIKDKYQLKFSKKDGSVNNVKFDEYDDNIKLVEADGTTGTYKVTRNTVFFDVKKASDFDGTTVTEVKDVDVVSWDSIKDKDDIKYAAVKLKGNKRDVEYVFILDSDSALSSKGEYGFVTAFKKVGRDDAVVITRIDGEKLTLVYDDNPKTGYFSDNGETPKFEKGSFIRYELDSDGDIDEMQVIATASTKGGYYVTGAGSKSLSSLSIESISFGIVDKSTTNSIVLLDTDGETAKGNVIVNSDTVYVDLVDHGEMEIVGGVNRGDFVLAIDTDDKGNAADFVVIIDEDMLDDGDSKTTPPPASGDTVTYIIDATYAWDVFGQLKGTDAEEETVYVKLADIETFKLGTTTVDKAVMLEWLKTKTTGTFVIDITDDVLSVRDVPASEIKAAALEVIYGYAAAEDASDLTVELLELAGIENVVVANLDDYKAALEDEDIDTLSEVQDAVDQVNVNKVAAAISTTFTAEGSVGEVKMPEVPTGYTIAVNTSSDANVYDTDGKIVAAGTANVVYTVTHTGSGKTADTASVTVTVVVTP